MVFCIGNLDIKICEGYSNAEATKCCKKYNGCYYDERIRLHYAEGHMKKHLKKLRMYNSNLP